MERTVVVKEMSFAGQMRLEKVEKPGLQDIYRESLSAEDFKLLEELGKEEGYLISTAYAKVTGFTTPKDEVINALIESLPKEKKEKIRAEFEKTDGDWSKVAFMINNEAG